jgi:dethiobiotin synthetase
VDALRAAGVALAGVVVNRYPAENAGVAEESNPRVIEKFGRIPVLAVVPEEHISAPALPDGIVAAVQTVDWERFTFRQH